MATDASRTAKECVACTNFDLPGPFTSIEFNPLCFPLAGLPLYTRLALFFLVSKVNTNDSTARGVGLVSYYCWTERKRMKFLLMLLRLCFIPVL